MGALGSKSKLKTENISDDGYSLKPRFRGREKKKKSSAGELTEIPLPCLDDSAITASSSSMDPNLSFGDTQTLKPIVESSNEKYLFLEAEGLKLKKELFELKDRYEKSLLRTKELEVVIQKLEEGKPGIMGDHGDMESLASLQQRVDELVEKERAAMTENAQKNAKIKDLQKEIREMKLEMTEQANDILQLRSEREEITKIYSENFESYKKDVYAEYEEKFKSASEERDSKFMDLQGESERNSQMKYDVALRGFNIQLTMMERKNKILQDLFDSMREKYSNRESRPEDTEKITKLEEKVEFQKEKIRNLQRGIGEMKLLHPSIEKHKKKKRK